MTLRSEVGDVVPREAAEGHHGLCSFARVIEVGGMSRRYRFHRIAGLIKMPSRLISDVFSFSIYIYALC